jgi:murein L,D-transpeptidase YcbB/YkuD
LYVIYHFSKTTIEFNIKEVNMGYEYPGYLLQNYCEDQAVYGVQQALQYAGYNPGPIDGKFGSGTEEAVMNFQADNDLACDGIVGPNTWDVLMCAVGC